MIPPGKGMMETRPSPCRPALPQHSAWDQAQRVHGSPKLPFFEKTCCGLPVSIAVETPDDVT